MRLSKKHIAIFLIPWVFGCINEINPELPSSSGNLVVEAMISDQPRPYTVKLSRSIDFLDISAGLIMPKVENAEVVVEDDQGHSTVFSEISPGIYQSTLSGIMGRVGVGYKLKITLENGRTYESSTEVLLPNVGIGVSDFSFLTKKKLNELNNEVTVNGIEISVIPRVFDGSEEYYRWRWTGTYQVETFPQLNTLILPSGQIVPDPLPCSGYIVVPPGTLNDIRPVDPCECCDCWVTETSDLSIVSSTSLGSAKMNLGFIENDRSRFNVKYHVQIEQLSLSKDAHEFWKIINQAQNSGSLFSASNTSVPTNIQCLDDEREKVLGYFMVTSIDKLSLVLDKEDLEGRVALIDTLTIDCRDLVGSTNEKPIFW